MRRLRLLRRLLALIEAIASGDYERLSGMQAGDPGGAGPGRGGDLADGPARRAASSSTTRSGKRARSFCRGCWTLSSG